MTADELAKCGEDLLTATITNQSWARKYGQQLLAAAERCEAAENEARVLKHSEALTADALKQFATDCSTPTFQLARNAAAWREKVIGFHSVCTEENCILDGGPEHEEHFRRLAGKETT